ncbi:MAG: hypothetical protein AAF399_24300 [Bacteroidota bacterium]
MNIYSDRETLSQLREELSQFNSQMEGLVATPTLLSQLTVVESFADDEAYIKYQVYAIIAMYSGYSISDIEDHLHLKADLGINKTEKWIFKKKFNALIRELGGDKFATREECLKLVFVRDCRKLIQSKLG